MSIGLNVPCANLYNDKNETCLTTRLYLSHLIYSAQRGESSSKERSGKQLCQVIPVNRQMYGDNIAEN